MTPQPWARTGPGAAKDGKPRFDLDQFDDAYFDRLRERVERGRRCRDLRRRDAVRRLGAAPEPAAGPHRGPPVPRRATTSTASPRARSTTSRCCRSTRGSQAIQEAYIQQVVDTLHDLPNVLWEVANESSRRRRVTGTSPSSWAWTSRRSGATPPQWQYWVIDIVKRHEAERGYEPHPIGMTMQFPVADQTRVNEPLLRSRADWISPGYDDEMFADGGHPMAPGSPPSRWFADPPPADGTKVDHQRHRSLRAGPGRRALGMEVVPARPPPDPHGLRADRRVRAAASGRGVRAVRGFEPARWAMGDTRRYAERMSLIDMEPRPDRSSTGFALAPGASTWCSSPSPAARSRSTPSPAGTRRSGST